MNPPSSGLMSESTHGKLRFLLGFGLFFTALWLLWGTPVVYPLKIFVVLLHELSHAMAVWATGGTVDSITLDPRQGGATYFTGGNAHLPAIPNQPLQLAFIEPSQKVAVFPEDVQVRS